jgi:hypothetical protein
MKANSAKVRCFWAESDPLLLDYHDKEWGVPQYDSRALWEVLMLECFQAGLSWLIVLKKREALRRHSDSLPQQRLRVLGMMIFKSSWMNHGSSAPAQRSQRRSREHRYFWRCRSLVKILRPSYGDSQAIQRTCGEHHECVHRDSSPDPPPKLLVPHATGPLAGILFGGLLSAWWQRRQWRTENMKQEYRELLSTLAASFSMIITADESYRY